MIRRAALLVLLVALGGCLGPTPPGTQTPTPGTPGTAPPTTSSAPPTTSWHTDCPYYLHVDVATDEQVADADRVLAYDDLPPARQREFRRALENGTIELDRLPDPWGAPRIVSYRGEHYYVVASTC